MLHAKQRELVIHSLYTTNPSLHNNKSLPSQQQIPPLMATNPSLFKLYRSRNTGLADGLKGLKGKRKKRETKPKRGVLQCSDRRALRWKAPKRAKQAHQVLIQIPRPSSCCAPSTTVQGDSSACGCFAPSRRSLRLVSCAHGQSGLRVVLVWLLRNNAYRGLTGAYRVICM
uniref:Uncharacterized protein n=1 Tax=uncultured prokaryote TaxID=198431 RepID=A0A0H5Q6I4_9ZZZZ|nr:hypothetical protein [uncultured prokaryote]